MSSVQSFLRQRVVGNTLLTIDTANLYVMVAATGNYQGNYPPGTMLAAAAGVAGGSPTIARDMGKTITAAVNGGTLGAFRAVQLLTPVTLASATAASNFGVQGSVPASITAGNAGDMGFNTFYVPIVNGGVIASGVSVTTSAPRLGSVF